MVGKLKPLNVERETRPGKYPDGDGLYLVVASATSKNWSYRYWKDGKQRWLGLGVEPQEVVLGQTEPADRRLRFYTTVGSVPVVLVQPDRQLLGAPI